ncbi:MAG TPA: methylmalonyl-CoA mutase family protein [Candidatus Cloacimonas acidaminovorans]|nr:methylmalonyl-CoA mutase family protein [Candidatus Cloacimonas acidaminovorans]
MDSEIKLNLLQEFPPPSFEEWLQVVQAGLKGADFDKVLKTKTTEGITLQPIYRQEDIEGIPFLGSQPGSSPFVRGNNPLRFLTEGWLIAQNHTDTDPKILNQKLLKELNQGLTAVNITLSNKISTEGVKIQNLADWETLLEGINLQAAPLFMQLGIEDREILITFVQYAVKHNIELKSLESAIGLDYIGELAEKGYLPCTLADAEQKLAEIVKWNVEKMPRNRIISIDTSIYEEAGASSVQELAFALATAIYYLRQLLNSGVTIEQVAPLLQVKLALGSNFFMEIAKVRALRLLWAEMIKSFGGEEDKQKVWIHGKTAKFNKTIYDIYVNVLRTTTESFAGVIGGVDSLEIGCFNELIAQPDEFSTRLARNQQIILKEEAHFDKVIDPAGGCYYIEWLTNELAKSAWQLMQEIEGKGGMLEYVTKGEIHQEVETVVRERIEAVNKRKNIFVGINMYANPEEKLPTLQRDDKPVSKEDKAFILKDGALPKHRAVEEIECLRRQIEASQSNKKIFLLNLGTLADYKARADFALNFFPVGGLEVIYPNGFNTVEEAVTAAEKSGASAFCICSTDENYVSLVPEICAKMKGKILILAGYPADKIEEYKQVGINCFIHLKADVVSTLRDLAKQMEVLK